MKTNDLKSYKIIQLLLCAMMLVFVMQQAAPVFSDEDDVTVESGGKHNGPISVDPIGQEEGFSAVLYNNTNGLPTSEANDIVQTREGFIWIGSYGGLIRYDGSRFERLDSTGGITSVRCLYVDSRNRLWVGTNDNGVILIDNDKQLQWDLINGMKSVSIRSILEGKDGNFYIATTEGLAIIDQDLQLSYLEDDRVINTFLHELRLAADGKVYAVTNSGDVVAIRDGKIDQYYPFSQRSVKGINCILPDPEDPDLFYVETLEGIVYHDSLSSGFEGSEPIDISPLYQVQSFESIDGKTWICTRNGVGVLDDTGFHILKNIPMNSSIGHVMTDYEGNLWFTSTREGVMKVVKNRFVDIFERYDLSKRVVNSTCMYDGTLFIATDTGLLAIGEEGVLDKVPLNQKTAVYGEDDETDNLLKLLNNCRIRSLIRDSKDRLWISTWRHYGALCYDHGDLKSYKKENGLASNLVRAVCECEDGRYLVACNGGVSIIRDGKVVVSYSEKDGITNTDILSVSAGEGTDIIIGTDGDGIYVIAGRGMKHIDHTEGLTSDSVMRIKKDAKRGVYWIVTGNSLSWLDSKYNLTTADLFPYSNNFDLYENSKGELWVLSGNGIYVAKADDILEDREINALHYSISNGMPCIATANSYSELTEDGDLYISGTTGVAKVNIEAPFEDVGELRFAVPYVDADNTRIFPDETGRFIIPAETKKLTIYGYIYTYSLVDPEITYRLDGFDEYDTTGVAKDLFPVYYTNLPGGTYNFIMQLKHSMSDDVVGSAVQIVKEKAMYEQLWFYVYAGLSSLLVGFALISLYVDARERKLEKKHKEESEKQRIGNELAMGNNIQRSMLPHVFPPFPDRDEFEIYASMDPAREVGGDFYDFFFIDDDHLCLVMADVSGKGIPGALFMMVSKSVLHNSAMFSGSPDVILSLTNDAICSNNQAQMFVTVWLGILEISTGRLTAANAGHEYPIIKDADGSFEILKDKHDFVIGGMEGITYHEYELNLSVGSKIFLYTDGIPDASDADNKMFGMERLLKALNKAPDEKPEQILTNVREAVDRFVSGAEQFDDLTMLCMEYKGKQK